MDLNSTPRSARGIPEQIRPSRTTAEVHPATQKGLDKAAGFKTLLQARLDPQPSPGKTLDHNKEALPQDRNLVSLGTISSDVPTVSHLLFKTPYKKSCWDIIHNEINAGKPFRSIKSGTPIFMDPETRELVWENEKPKASGALAQARPAGPEAPDPSPPELGGIPCLESSYSGSLATDGAGLANAVRSFIGTDYSKMDCYELLIGGLQNLGVQYRGRGGLGERLVQKAVNKGQVSNRYLNGEGLVGTSGDNVYQKRLLKVKDPDHETEQVMLEMSRVLQDGQILSFSMRTRGHTGVVSQRNGVWTFINSGTLDHTVSKARLHKGVGEENLKAELKNWLRLAFEKKEGLQISVGSLDMDRLNAFIPSRSQGVEKA